MVNIRHGLLSVFGTGTAKGYQRAQFDDAFAR
jgi:hypothetical protein